MKQKTSRHSTSGLRPSRRGSVYLLVLMVGMIITVIGVSGAALSRSKLRTAEAATEAGDAKTLASTAVEHALATIEVNPLWKTIYVGQNLPAPVSFGDGTFKWRITDAGDGIFKITGTGTRGKATRILSARYDEGSTSTVLEKAVYAAGNITAGATTTYINGPIVSGGTYTNNSVTNGNVEAVALVNAGTINGTFTAKVPQTTPPSSIFNTYKGMATTIPYASTIGSISLKLISAAVNPYGSPNANAIYAIDVPAASTLTITKSRIAGTLVVSLGAGATLRIQQANLWEKGAGNFPILLVKATGIANIDFNGFTQQLSEPGTLVNFNPAGTPYNGVSDNDILDLYPTEFRGLIHIFGSGAITSSGSNFSLTGALITEGTLSVGSNAFFTLDTSLKSNPPMGYGSPRSVTNWRWEVLP